MCRKKCKLNFCEKFCFFSKDLKSISQIFKAKITYTTNAKPLKTIEYQDQACPKKATNNSMQCFPSTSLVNTFDAGEKPISCLKYGDMVQTVDTRTNKIVYTKFITYLHRDDHALSEFIQIKTNKNKAIKMTDKHLIAKMAGNQNIEYVFAQNLNVNDVLVSYDDDAENVVYEEIIEIKKYVEEMGVYAPLTESGTLLVDNILVSCYANTNTQDWAHFAFKFYVHAKNVYEFLLDNLSRRNDADRMQHGIHWYADFLINSLPYTHKFLN